MHAYCFVCSVTKAYIVHGSLTLSKATVCFIDFFCRKYEEICPPQVDEFCYITDNTYGRREASVHRIYIFKDILACLRLNDVGIPYQVLEMEKKVLDRLKFELAGPTTKTFLRLLYFA